MARHFRTKRTVDARYAAALRRRGVAAALFSVLGIVGLGAVLWTVKIWMNQDDLPRFVTYVPPQEEVASEEQQKATTLTAGQPPAAPPVDLCITTETSELATIALSTEVEGMGTGSSPLGADIGGNGLGTGIGSDSGLGMGNKKRVESSFCGHFWDLKRTNNGSDSRLKDAAANMAVLELESRFYNKGWVMSEFSAYLESKEKLYATSFYMPNCMDLEAARAYDPTGKQKLSKSRWVAVYRAKVKAPKTGTFRFVGAGDSVLAVRFDGKNVLACGFHDLKNNVWNGFHIIDNPSCAKDRNLISYKGCEFWNDQFGGFVAGEPFDVVKGNWYEMQVLVSEIGGGMFGFCLLVDDMSEEGGKVTSDRKPLYQLFRTNFDTPDAQAFYDSIKYRPDAEEEVNPPYDADSMIWEAKPLDSRGK